MDTKTYLQQIERLDRKIQNKFAEIEQLNEQIAKETKELREMLAK